MFLEPVWKAAVVAVRPTEDSQKWIFTVIDFDIMKLGVSVHSSQQSVFSSIKLTPGSTAIGVLLLTNWTIRA